MKFFKTFLLIIFSFLITYFPLKPMEQEKQVKIIVLPYAFKNSKTLVLGMLEDTWAPFVKLVPIEKIKGEQFHKKIDYTIATAILRKKTNIVAKSISYIFSNVILKNFKTEAIKIAEQKIIDLFPQTKSNQAGIKYLLEAINLEEENYYVNENYSLAIFFINIPYIPCLSLPENHKENLDFHKKSGEGTLQKNLSLWIEITQITSCCNNSGFIRLLKKFEIQKIISRLKKINQTDSDDDIITKILEFSSDDEI